MSVFNIFRGLPVRARRLIAPKYRPEKHYMRGFGPASAARAAVSR